MEKIYLRKAFQTEAPSPIRIKWGYIPATLPLLLLSVVGFEYKAFLIFIIPLAACFAQIFYPTFTGWATVFAAYAGLSAIYVSGVIFDFTLFIIKGGPSAIFLETFDGVLFVIALGIFLGILWWISGQRPVTSVPPPAVPAIPGDNREDIIQPPLN